MTDAENRQSKLSEQVTRGADAEFVLKQLQGAFSALEADCFDAFRHSDVHDDSGRKTCRLYLKVLDDVRTRFEVAVRNGEAAQKELIRIKPKSVVRKIING